MRYASQMIDLSIVIVNYNTRDLLRDCLRSLQDSRGNCEIEVIVVDNASHDGSADMVRGEFPGVRLLAMQENTWFCGGNNAGIEAATGRYVLLLNPDTVVEPDALALMVGFMEANPDYVGVTAQMRYPEGGIQRTCSRLPPYSYLVLNHTPVGWVFRKWRRLENTELWYESWGREIDYDVEVIPGSCTLMRRADIMLDGDLLLYFPEEDLSQRFPGKRRYLAGARIIHREKSTTQTWLATKIYFRDMLVYTRKHHGIVAAVLLWLLSRPVLWGMTLKQRFR